MTVKKPSPWCVLNAARISVVAVLLPALSAEAQADDASPPSQGTVTQAQTSDGGSAVLVPPVAVTAAPIPPTPDQKLQLEGSADSGYRVDSTNITGPFGNMPLQDAPYSISVIPQSMIENVQASSPDQLFKMNPLTQSIQPNSINQRAEPNLRGFLQTDNLEDGIRSSNGWGVALEDTERVEILSGLSGFLYGADRVGGEVNYVTKRPTDTPLSDITIGDYGGANGYVHGDFGGPLGDGTLAYRANLVVQGGGTAIDHTSLNRYLGSLALDWHATDNLLFQVYGAHYDAEQYGIEPTWLLGTAKAYSSAPDADKLWSEPWSHERVVTDKGMVNATWNISDVFTFRSAFRYAQYVDRLDAISNQIEANGTYVQSFQARAPRLLQNYGGYDFLDAAFNTGFVAHKLTIGAYGDQSIFNQHEDEQKTVTVGTFSLTDPTYVAQPPNIVGTLPTFPTAKVLTTNYVIGDQVKFSDAWSAVIGANYAGIKEQDYSAPEVLTQAAYDKARATPTVNLIYKPVDTVSTYVSYIQSLQEGEVVPTSGIDYTNAGAVLAPYVSSQYEVGSKATLDGALLTAALFRIEKANQFAVNNGNGTETYEQSGREVHQGLETTLSGKVTDQLTLWGGVTLMQAKVESAANNPSIQGKRPINVSDHMAKLYAEYAVPQLPGFVLTGGAYYMGDFYADAANTQRLPSYVVGDVGARYTIGLEHRELIFRFNITNVGNASYWQSSNWVGDPRTFLFSAEMTF